MEIKGFIETSFVDWSGKICAVVFLPRCTFRCPFCHNHGLVLNPDEYDTIPLKHVIASLEKNSDWLDGLTITGGEPLIHADIGDLCESVKSLGLGVKIDTNGSLPDRLEDLIGMDVVDYVAMDVKAPLTVEEYSRVTGVDLIDRLADVKRSIELIMNSDIEYEFRTTVVPGLHDEKSVERIASALKNAKKYVLQRFRSGNTMDPDMRELRTFTDEEMHEFVKVARKHIPTAEWREG